MNESGTVSAGDVTGSTTGSSTRDLNSGSGESPSGSQSGSVADPSKVKSQMNTLNTSNISNLSMMNLDEITQVFAYLLVLVLLLWSARFFLKRGKQSQDPDLEHNQINILSQQVINLNPRQRIILVEARGHTFVVGACDRGGMSALAHLESPNGPLGSSSISQGTLNQASGALDALNHLSNESYAISDAYYGDEHYSDARYQHTSSAPRSTPLDGSGIQFEENTFVNEHEEESFTGGARAPHADIIARQAMSQPVAQPIGSAHTQSGRSRVDPMSTLDSYAEASLNPAPVSSPHSSEEERADDDVQPEHLLKLIQNLNNSNG